MCLQSKIADGILAKSFSASAPLFEPLKFLGGSYKEEEGECQLGSVWIKEVQQAYMVHGDFLYLFMLSLNTLQTQLSDQLPLALPFSVLVLGSLG